MIFIKNTIAVNTVMEHFKLYSETCIFYRCPILDLVDPVCVTENEVLAKSDTHCGLIKSTTGPFSVCVNADPGSADIFFDNCVYDTCAYTEKESSCAGLEAFVAKCFSKGFLPSPTWRTDIDCGKLNGLIKSTTCIVINILLLIYFPLYFYKQRYGLSIRNVIRGSNFCLPCNL